MDLDLSLLFRGLAIGLAIAAPVGPIGVLCIRRTVAAGRVAGLATGLGAATADALYGALAAFGLTLLTDFMVDQQGLLRLVGGAFLLVLGIRTFRAPPASEAAEIRGTGLAAAYLSTFFLTLTNPLTILSFAGIFAGVGIHTRAGNPLTLVLGVFLGSAFWWLFLSGAVSLFRERVSGAGFRWINRGSGAILIGFGLLALLPVG